MALLGRLQVPLLEIAGTLVKCYCHSSSLAARSPVPAFVNDFNPTRPLHIPQSLPKLSAPLEPVSVTQAKSNWRDSKASVCISERALVRKNLGGARLVGAGGRTLRI